MPRIRVEWLQGRTTQQRENLAQLITDAVVKVANVTPDQVTVVFDETAPELMFKASRAYRPIVPSS